MTGHQPQMDSNHHPPSTPIDQISTALPSVVADESDESDSDLSTSSSSPNIKEHKVEQDSSQSYYSTDTSVDDRLNFERPKSGCDGLSWNALPLAINSSFLSKRMQ